MERALRKDILILGMTMTALCLVVASMDWGLVTLARTEWVAFFYPHALDLTGLFAGAQHYPPWIFVVMRPLALLLPVWGGYVAIWGLSLIVTTRYLRAWWRVLLFVVSTPVMLTLLYSNVDVLLLVALMTPLWLALLIVSCKPQVLAGWAVRRWLAGGTRVWQLFPLVVVSVASLAVWGWWPGLLVTDGLASNLSISWWPWSVPFGIVLLATRSPWLWLAGSAMLSPYLQLYHLAPVLAYLYRRAGLATLVLASALSWVALVAIVGV